jgi:hypothetical protein
VHKSIADLGHINEIPKWFALNPGHDYAQWAKPSRESPNFPLLMLAALVLEDICANC